MDQEQVRKQAKEILDNFVKALEKINVKEAGVERKEDRRKEEVLSETNKFDRKIMFSNAPKTKDDCIEAEKGGWV